MKILEEINYKLFDFFGNFNWSFCRGHTNCYGLGFKKYISDQFDALGTNTLFVAPGKLLESGGMGASSLLGNRF